MDKERNEGGLTPRSSF